MKKNLSHYVFEVIAIFIGISGSFLVEDYRINKIKKKQIIYALEALNESLTSDSASLASNLGAYDSRISIINDWRNEDLKTVPDSTIFMHFLALNSSIPFSLDMTGYEIFIETEGKELIKNPELRKKIGDYYNQTGLLMENQSSAENEYLRNLVNSLLISEFEYPPKTLANPEGLKKIYLPFKEFIHKYPEARNRLGNHQIFLSFNKGTTNTTLIATLDLKREIANEISLSR